MNKCYHSRKHGFIVLFGITLYNLNGILNRSLPADSFFYKKLEDAALLDALIEFHVSYAYSNKNAVRVIQTRSYPRVFVGPFNKISAIKIALLV